MTPFTYIGAATAAEALEHAQHGAIYIAGGTDLLQLMQERVVEPGELVGINDLPLSGISHQPNGFRIGALTRLSEVADDLVMNERLPALAQSLRETASPQVRNMATVGGNLLQRTRCLYFRDVATPCNKRVVESGCSALHGQNRLNAIFGGSESCIAVHASDLAVALAALDAEVIASTGTTERSIRIEDFYPLPGETPQIETVLEMGEMITAIWIPIAGAGLRSHYFKVRDRSSFEWALTSCAVAIGFDGTEIFEARVAVGGVATKPWRLPHVERMLVGHAFDAATIGAAADAAADGAVVHEHNAFKVPLLKRTVARALSNLMADVRAAS